MRLLKALGWEINPAPLPPLGYDSSPVGTFSTIPLRGRAAGTELQSDSSLSSAASPYVSILQLKECC